MIVAARADVSAYSAKADRGSEKTRILLKKDCAW